MPCVDSSRLASQNFTLRCWSVQPCVRPDSKSLSAAMAEPQTKRRVDSIAAELPFCVRGFDFLRALNHNLSRRLAASAPLWFVCGSREGGWDVRQFA